MKSKTKDVGELRKIKVLLFILSILNILKFVDLFEICYRVFAEVFRIVS